MWSVETSIPGEQFFDAMSDLSAWLAYQRIENSSFSYSRSRTGEVRFRISFQAAGEADRFAERFGGAVALETLAG